MRSFGRGSEAPWGGIPCLGAGLMVSVAAGLSYGRWYEVASPCVPVFGRSLAIPARNWRINVDTKKCTEP